MTFPFLTNTKDKIAHDKLFNALRSKEFARLEKNRQVYLDYTGGNLYALTQLKSHQSLLSKNILGNPHSTNPSSQLSTHLVAEARQKVLEFFNAQDNYYCIFTQNATAALKIVGECYPFKEGSTLCILADNHNSVNGIREYCKGKEGDIVYSPIQYEDLRLDAQQLEENLNAGKPDVPKLFAYPAQSNVSGVKHSLEWIAKAQGKGWDVLLDAAAFVPSSPLNLAQYSPDFVSVSFYKIFGYPTGIGCLLVRKEKFNLLKKQWFAGGTVKLVSVKSNHHFLAADHERFENGTVNYLDIPAVKIGLDMVEKIGMDKIQERVSALSGFLYNELRQLKHKNGQSIVKIFGPAERKDVGGTLIMNFYKSDGSPFAFEEIEAKTNALNISIRSGCFCNPGIDEVNNCLTTEELGQYFSSRDSGDYHDMIKALGKMRGATRVSVGWATTCKDLQVFINFVKGLA